MSNLRNAKRETAKG